MSIPSKTLSSGGSHDAGGVDAASASSTCRSSAARRRVISGTLGGVATRPPRRGRDRRVILGGDSESGIAGRPTRDFVSGRLLSYRRVGGEVNA
jgi:hypothetical protein